jgi:hypothetical protein
MAIPRNMYKIPTTYSVHPPSRIQDECVSAHPPLDFNPLPCVGTALMPVATWSREVHSYMTSKIVLTATKVELRGDENVGQCQNHALNGKDAYMNMRQARLARIFGTRLESCCTRTRATCLCVLFSVHMPTFSRALTCRARRGVASRYARQK